MLSWAPANWWAGSPGRLEPVTVDPLRNVVTRVPAHTDDPQLDFIELYNHGSQPADISGCTSRRAQHQQFLIPEHRLPPRASSGSTKTSSASP